MKFVYTYYLTCLEFADAIAEGEKAARLVPKSKWYKYDLAKFYLADKQLDKAEKEFITLLKLDDEMTKLWDAPVKTAGLRWGM